MSGGFVTVIVLLGSNVSSEYLIGEYMIELLVLSVGFIIGYYAASYKWSSNSRDYRRIEFLGELYKVLRDDDPIFNPSDDDIERMRLGAIIRRNYNEDGG